MCFDWDEEPKVPLLTLTEWMQCPAAHAQSAVTLDCNMSNKDAVVMLTVPENRRKKQQLLLMYTII